MSDVADEESLVISAAAQKQLQKAAGEAAAKQRQALEDEARAKGFGKLYASLGGGRKGLEACVAVEALCEVCCDVAEGCS